MSDVDPSREQIEQQIDVAAAAGKWPDAVVSAAKQAVADVSSVSNQQAKATLMNEIVHPWFADDSKTVADLQAAVAEFVQ